MKATLKKINGMEGGPHTPALWAVSLNGEEIGFFTKYADTRTETHPYIAYAVIGADNKHLGAFYHKDGGRYAATDAIIEAATA